VREPTADESERLRRERLCNPVLWPRATRQDRLRDALLVGGVHVHGAPAYRFALPGDGECEAWFFADGEPAGCTFRDPLRGAKVGRERGWSGGPRTSGAVDEAWFRRQP